MGVYSGRAKLEFCDRLGPDWERLADLLEVTQADREGFRAGHPQRLLWAWAERRVWLRKLPDALDDIGRGDLAEFLRGDLTRPRSAVLSGEDDPAAHIRAFDTAFFDLSEVRARIEDELESEPGPVAFVLARPDEMYVVKLCEWLEHCVEDVRRRPAVSLNPLQGGVATALRHIEALRPVLAMSHVLCLVNIHSPQVRAEDVRRFWSAVRERFQGLDRWLVLLVLVHAGDLSVDGMPALPAPRFAKDHLLEWSRGLLHTLRWPQALARSLTRALITYASVAGELDVRLVYDALGGVVHDVRDNRDWIRGELERGSYVAHPAQN